MSEDWRMDSDERQHLKDYFSDRKSIPSVSYTHLRAHETV